jgi:glucose/arabinose dehydrogenase
MKRSIRVVTRAAPLALALTAVVACGNPGPTPASIAPAATPTSAVAGAGPSASPTAGPASAVPSTPAGPDLAAVQLVVEPVVGGLDQPVFVTHAGDGSGRLFVAEQPGRVRVIEGGALRESPFLDITDRVTSGGERGLLGLAFPPGFGPTRPLVYAHYSGEDGATVISEFRLSAHDTGVLDRGSERVILTEPQPYANHNGGWIGFDADGMLLVALGDGGSGGDPEDRASDLGTILGKMLRIDVLGAADGQAYTIPDDNPFVGVDGTPRLEILHYGLRNPFRASVDPGTGDLWIGDVGQNAWEEVDVARTGARGLDFGWRRWEGRHCYNPPTGCDPAGVTMPVAEYGHGLGCSVIGGVVYRGEAIPALRGGYLFSDYCTGTLWAIDAGSNAVQAPATLVETGASVSSIGTGEDGEVYLTDLGRGRVLRLAPGG